MAIGKKQVDVRCPTCGKLLLKLDANSLLQGGIEVVCRNCKATVRVEPGEVSVFMAQHQNGSGVKNPT